MTTTSVLLLRLLFWHVIKELNGALRLPRNRMINVWSMYTKDDYTHKMAVAEKKANGFYC